MRLLDCLFGRLTRAVQHTRSHARGGAPSAAVARDLLQVAHKPDKQDRAGCCCLLSMSSEDEDERGREHELPVDLVPAAFRSCSGPSVPGTQEPSSCFAAQSGYTCVPVCVPHHPPAAITFDSDRNRSPTRARNNMRGLVAASVEACLFVWARLFACGSPSNKGSVKSSASQRLAFLARGTTRCADKILLGGSFRDPAALP